MSTDTVLFIVLGVFSLGGFNVGFMKSIGMLAGTLVSAYLTFQFIDPVFSFVGSWFGNGELVKVFVYFFLFILISKLVGLLFWLLERLLGLLSWIPFISLIDRLFGAALGFLEGILLCGFVLLYASHILPKEVLTPWLHNAVYSMQLLDVAMMITLFFPPMLKEFFVSSSVFIKSWMPN